MFDVDEEGITLVSVDGYRLALRREKVKIGQPMKFIVPGKTLSEVSKLLGDEDTPTELFPANTLCSTSTDIASSPACWRGNFWITTPPSLKTHHYCKNLHPQLYGLH